MSKLKSSREYGTLYTHTLYGLRSKGYYESEYTVYHFIATDTRKNIEYAAAVVARSQMEAYIGLLDVGYEVLEIL